MRVVLIFCACIAVAVAGEVKTVKKQKPAATSQGVVTTSSKDGDEPKVTVSEYTIDGQPFKSISVENGTPGKGYSYMNSYSYGPGDKSGKGVITTNSVGNGVSVSSSSSSGDGTFSSGQTASSSGVQFGPAPPPFLPIPPPPPVFIPPPPPVFIPGPPPFYFGPQPPFIPRPRPPFYYGPPPPYNFGPRPPFFSDPPARKPVAQKRRTKTKASSDDDVCSRTELKKTNKRVKDAFLSLYCNFKYYDEDLKPKQFLKHYIAKYANPKTLLPSELARVKIMRSWPSLALDLKKRFAGRNYTCLIDFKKRHFASKVPGQVNSRKFTKYLLPVISRKGACRKVKVFPQTPQPVKAAKSIVGPKNGRKYRGVKTTVLEFC